MTGRGWEKGNAVSVEAALIIPALAMFVALVVVLAQTALAQQAVTAAANEAARAASLERTTVQARRAASDTLSQALLDAGVDCVEQSATVDVAGVIAPLGNSSAVNVSVTCLIRFDLSLPGFPGGRTVTGHGTSPVDTYRGR